MTDLELSEFEAETFFVPAVIDYTCVLAYDGREDGVLSRVWDGLRPRIGKGCWDGAGIYVMILRG